MLKYVSGCTKKEIVLSEDKIRAHIKTSGLYGKKWKVNTSKIGLSNTITDVTMEPKEYTIKIDFLGNASERAENIESFIIATEQDVSNMTLGKLYLNEQYIECLVIGSSYGQAGKRRGVQNTIQVYVPNPYWCREVLHQFPVIIPEDTSDVSDKTYSYVYPYTYALNLQERNFINEHYSDTDFEIIIYGPVENPAITVASHIYEVECSLAENEYLVINTLNKKVYKVVEDGSKSTQYHYRNRDYYIFQKIPSGFCSVYWNGLFGFDVRLIEQRSEPKWI